MKVVPKIGKDKKTPPLSSVMSRSHLSKFSIWLRNGLFVSHKFIKNKIDHVHGEFTTLSS